MKRDRNANTTREVLDQAFTQIVYADCHDRLLPAASSHHRLAQQEAEA